MKISAPYLSLYSHKMSQLRLKAPLTVCREDLTVSVETHGVPSPGFGDSLKLLLWEIIDPGNFFLQDYLAGTLETVFYLEQL